MSREPKYLSDAEVEILELVATATMGEPKEAKRAIAEFLRRGHDIKAGYEMATRLIELLDGSTGRPNKNTGTTLYATRPNPLHEQIRDRFKKLLAKGSTKRAAYEVLTEDYRLGNRSLERICKGIKKPTKNS